MHEDVEAKFMSDMDLNLKAPPAIAAEPRLIVRNTFLDIEDDEELERKAECQAPDPGESLQDFMDLVLRSWSDWSFLFGPKRC